MSNNTIATRGAITTADLMLRLAGRDFGTVMEDATRFQQPVPDFLQPIARELKAGSEILKLTDPIEDAIFAAYRHDIRLFQARLDQFAGWVKSCIEASVKHGSDRDVRDAAVKTGWEFVQQHVPPIAEAPLIDLPAERAALPAAQLLAELKQEVEIGVDSMLRRFCLWLDLLVAKEYVGIVHFTGPTTGHYYYFRPYTMHTVKVTDRTEISVDQTVPFGQQTTYTNISGNSHKIIEWVERHDHHIVRARVDTLPDYTEIIPGRIISALERAPEWLRPHLRIVSGDITKEVVARRVVRDTTEVHERTTSVYKGSPAVVLGSYVLNGWSSDDTDREDSGYYRGQKVYSAAKQAARSRTLRVLLLAVAIVGFIVGCIWYGVHRANVSAQTSYDQYYAQVTQGKETFVLTKEQMVTLPRGEPLYYLGTRQENSRFGVFATNLSIQWRACESCRPTLRNRFDVPLPESAPETYYGDVALGGIMQYPATMHILYMDSSQVRFTISYYIKD